MNTPIRRSKQPTLHLLAALTFIVALMFTGTARALQVTDDRGVIVNFDKSPQRIVSLLPSLTEVVCALDQCQRLVGVDRSTLERTVRPSAHVLGKIARTGRLAAPADGDPRRQ